MNLTFAILVSTLASFVVGYLLGGSFGFRMGIRAATRHRNPDWPYV